MPQFLFDTDHLTLFHHKHPTLMQRMVLQPADFVAICPINIEETMRGRLGPLGRVLAGIKHVQAYARLVAAEEMFRLFPLVPFPSRTKSRFPASPAKKWVASDSPGRDNSHFASGASPVFAARFLAGL